MNNKLSDKGWHAMRQLLDREMPVERKRRPLAWLWMAALLLGIGISLGWMYWPEKTGPNQMPVAGHELPLKPSAPLQNGAVPATEVAETAAPQIKNMPQGNPPAQPPVILASPHKNTGRIKSAETLPVETTAGATVDFTQTSTLQLIEPSEIEILENRSNQTPKTNSNGLAAAPEQFIPSTQMATEITEAAKQPTIAALSPIPNKPNPTQLQSQITRAPQFPELPSSRITPIAATSKNKPWAFGATAGIFSSFQPAYAGFNLGFSAKWRPRSNWGLRSGLGYQFQVLRENDRPILSLSTDSYVQVTGDQKALAPNGVTNTADVDYSTPIYIPVSRLHRVEAPLLAYWQPLKRWSVYGGGVVGATLVAQTGTHSLRNNTVLEIQAGDPARNLRAEISDQLRNWDFRWSLGIGFQATPRISFDFFLHNPLHFSKISGSSALLDPFGTPTGYGGESTYSKLAQQRPDGAGKNSLLHFTTTVFF